MRPNQDLSQTSPPPCLRSSIPLLNTIPFHEIPLLKNLNHETSLTTKLFRSIIFKLLAFTFAMVTLPIGSYFLTVNALFSGM